MLIVSTPGETIHTNDGLNSGLKMSALKFLYGGKFTYYITVDNSTKIFLNAMLLVIRYYYCPINHHYYLHYISLQMT